MIMYPKNVNEWPVIKVYDRDFRQVLLNMANVITELELWEWLRNYSPDVNKGFMFSDEPNIYKIGDQVLSDGHSGGTFAYAMRCMEIIAKEGFSKLKG